MSVTLNCQFEYKITLPVKTRAIGRFGRTVFMAIRLIAVRIIFVSSFLCCLCFSVHFLLVWFCFVFVLSFRKKVELVTDRLRDKEKVQRCLRKETTDILTEQEPF